MKKRLFKFTLCAVLLAAGTSMYADGVSDTGENTGTETDNGPVTLNDAGKTKISWKAFVNAINNPVKVTNAPLDEESDVVINYNKANQDLKDANDAKTKAEKDLADATDALEGNAEKKIKGAVQEQIEAKLEQTKAVSTLAAARNAYNEANDENNAAAADLAAANAELNDLNDQLGTANKNLSDAQTALYNAYQKKIDDNQAIIDDNNNNKIPAAKKEQTRWKGLMDALVVNTAQWLVDAKAAAEKFSTCFKANASGDAVTIYYKYIALNDEDLSELDLSFIPQEGWLSGEASAVYTILRSNPGPTTVIDEIVINFGKNAEGQNNYKKTNGVITINSLKLGQIAAQVLDRVDGINDSDYQTQSTDGTGTITNKTLYDQYAASYNEYTTQISNLEQQNNDLYAANINLSAKEKSSVEYTAVQSAQDTVDELNAPGTGKIPVLKGRIAGYNTIINKYKATTTPAPDSKPCTDANDNPISYLKWLSNAQTAAQTAKDNADQAVADAAEKVQTCQATVTTASTALSNAKNEEKAATTAFNAAKTAYDAAQAAANEAASATAMEKYNEITLDAGTVINADVQITKAYKGTITGNGSIINVNVADNAPLFKTFGGHVDDVAINGTFGANLTGASFTDVARWDGNGKIYSETGAETEFKSSALSDAFGAFGYALRDNEYFGVDFKDTKIVAAAAAPSKVFSLTAYDLPAGKDDTDPVPTQTYVQLGAQGSNVMKTIVNNNELTTYEVPQNRFAQSATADVAGLGLANVYYGTNNDCDMAKIVDRENFYCPVTVKAKAIDYTREFKKGYNSVCLPFTLSTNLSEKIVSICEYESVDFTAKKFWFKQNATSIKANTPALIVLEEDVDKVKFNIEGVTIAATDKTQIEKSDAMHGDSHSYGTLKKAHVNEFEGEEFSDYIYGLNTEGKFIAAAKNATFPAFRMVIGTQKAVASRENAPRSGDGLDVMSIGIHNENGVDITDQFKDLTTGVNDIKSDVSSLSIVGGQGAIKFNSDADYGKVKIYNINGALVTVANVMTGTTSVNVEKGIYIVMGKKVMVK